MVRKRRKTAMRRRRRCVPASGNAATGDGRVFTRRGFVFGLGAVAVGLIMYNPRMAFADEPWWDGSLIFRGYGARYASRFWNEVGSVQAGAGAEQAGNMYTGLQVSAKTPWVEWDISSRQFIRVATKITMACDFTTELYYHMRGKLEIACGSYNELNPSYNLWHTDSGDDTRFTLFHTVDGAPKGGVEEGSKVVVIDNEAGAGIHRDGCHVWTDYRGYPGSDYSVWIRRTDRDAMHGFQLRSWFWNYYYYGKDWYYQRADDPPIGFSTKWVKQRAKRVGIASEAQWAGRVLVISPATVPSLQLGVDGPRTGQGCGVFAAASSTRRHWIAAEHEDEHLAGTFRFVPVCAGDGSLSLGQAGGGPRFDASAAELQHCAGAIARRRCGCMGEGRANGFSAIAPAWRWIAWELRRKTARACSSIRTAMPMGSGATNRICGISKMLVSARRTAACSTLRALQTARRLPWAFRLAFPTPGPRSGPEAHRPMRRAFDTNTCGLPMTVREKPSPRFPRSRAAHACRSAVGACGLMRNRRRTWWERAGVPGLCVL